MAKKIILFISLLCSISFTSNSQTSKSRSFLQQEFIGDAIISPQLKKGPLEISRLSQIDSLFMAIQSGWEKVSEDSLRKYGKNVRPEEFNNIDAYCYLWALASITQNINIVTIYSDHLVEKYMTPALQRDYLMLRRLPDPDLIIETIHGGNLGNALALGSREGTSRQTFFETFKVYQEFDALFDSLAKDPDTAVAHAATKQVQDLETFYYPLNARYSFYKGEYDESFALLVTGLNVDKYSRGQAIDLARDLITAFKGKGAQDKSFAVLNTLAINTTPDNLDRDSIRAWYVSINKIRGMKMYENLQQKLSVSSFKFTDKHIDLPQNWDFAANALSLDKIRKAKYIIADFWETGCAPCMEEIPELNTFYAKLSSRDDIIFISFNTDLTLERYNKDDVTKLSKTRGIKFPVFCDNNSINLGKQLSVLGYPAKFILTTSGTLISKTDQSDMSLASFELFLKEHQQN